MRTIAATFGYLSLIFKLFGLATYAHLSVFAAVAVFMWLARKELYFWSWVVIFSANLCNGSAVIINGGKMPYAGVNFYAVSATHQRITEATKLLPLCDIFGIGTGMNYSVGDLIFLCGVVMASGFFVLGLIKDRRTSNVST